MKKLIGVLFIALFISSCHKEILQEPFWNSGKKFEFQNTTYLHRDGENVEIIYLSDYSEDNPEQVSVQVFKGVVGGQKAFTDNSAEDNFIYIADSFSCIGTYSSESISINTSAGNQSIKANVVGEIKSVGGGNSFDYRKIRSLTYSGKEFFPINPNANFISKENEIGQPISKLITEGNNCSFVRCVKGVSQQVSWSYSNGYMSISSGGLNVAGRIVGTKYSTPIILCDNGDMYVVQFYTLADNSQVACTCTMEFNLYKVERSRKSLNSSNAQFSLQIGDC